MTNPCNMRVILSLFCLFISISVSASNGFKVFDATLYTEKESLHEYSVADLKVIYEAEIFENKNTLQMPSDEKIRSLALKYKGHEWIVFDIERWDSGKESIIKNVRMYSDFLRKFKAYSPDVKVGYYGVLPIRDYWRSSGKKGVVSYNQWVDENAKLKELGNLVDGVFPSIYTFYHDMEGWTEYAKGQIVVARQLAGDKPVLPFIWPDYHESNKIFSHRYIGDKYWLHQISTLDNYADGIVIWGGWEYGKGKPQKWRENMNWWRVLKEYINKKSH